MKRLEKMPPEYHLSWEDKIKQAYKEAFQYIKKAVHTEPTDLFLKKIEKGIQNDIQLGYRASKLFRHLATPNIGPFVMEHPLQNKAPETQTPLHPFYIAMEDTQNAIAQQRLADPLKLFEKTKDIKGQWKNISLTPKHYEFSKVGEALQKFEQITPMPRSPLLLKETVIQGSTLFSYLSLIDTRTEKALLLNQFLPQDYFFKPTNIGGKTTDEHPSKHLPITLYQGTQNTNPDRNKNYFDPFSYFVLKHSAHRRHVDSLARDRTRMETCHIQRPKTRIRELGK